jgi:hypothetical protein
MGPKYRDMLTEMDRVKIAEYLHEKGEVTEFGGSGGVADVGNAGAPSGELHSAEAPGLDSSAE